MLGPEETYPEQSGLVIDEILAMLNNYTGVNVYDDVIMLLEQYDEPATCAIDPSWAMDRFVLTDGTVVQFVGGRHGWDIRP